MTVIGWILIAGFAAFMIGAVGWRIEYEQPPETSLPIMLADRSRLRWIHRWMIPAVATTAAGLGALAVSADEPWVSVAAFAYGIGAVVWVLSLTFRLTFGEWAAERTATTGSVPDTYPALARWMGLGHGIHMMAAYVTAIPLAWALAERGFIPDWLGVAGAVWGLVLGTLFLLPRTRFVAAPPFLAHVLTFAIGLSLI